MNLSTIIGTNLGATIESIGNTVRKFVTTDADQIKLQNELEIIIQKRESEIEQTIRKSLEAKERIITAELNQGDNYTKRARPTVVYFGLVVILYNYCIIPTIQMLKGLTLETFNLPTEFWIAWGGIVATWSIGRSSEKRGNKDKITSFITGN